MTLLTLLMKPTLATPGRQPILRERWACRVRMGSPRTRAGRTHLEDGGDGAGKVRLHHLHSSWAWVRGVKSLAPSEATLVSQMIRVEGVPTPDERELPNSRRPGPVSFT